LTARADDYLFLVVDKFVIDGRESKVKQSITYKPSQK